MTAFRAEALVRVWQVAVVDGEAPDESDPLYWSACADTIREARGIVQRCPDFAYAFVRRWPRSSLPLEVGYRELGSTETAVVTAVVVARMALDRARGTSAC